MKQYAFKNIHNKEEVYIVHGNSMYHAKYKLDQWIMKYKQHDIDYNDKIKEYNEYAKLENKVLKRLISRTRYPNLIELF